MDRPIVNGFSRLDPWDASKAPSVIADIEKEAITRVNWYMDWYKKYKAGKSDWSKFIRAVCVIFFVVSALIPVLISLNVKYVGFQYGYILSGIAGGLLFLDRFYGFSSGWIRYNKTLASLGNAKRDFEKIMQDAVLIHLANTLDGFQALVDTIRTFDDNVSAIVQTETDAWAAEFQAGNTELQAYFKDQVSQQKPGDLQINITNYIAYTNIVLFVNGDSKGIVTGGTILLSSLPPDNYTAKATAIAVPGGTNVEKTIVVTIKSNQLTVAEIKFL